MALTGGTGQRGAIKGKAGNRSPALKFMLLSVKQSDVLPLGALLPPCNQPGKASTEKDEGGRFGDGGRGSI